MSGWSGGARRGEGFDGFGATENAGKRQCGYRLSAGNIGEGAVWILSHEKFSPVGGTPLWGGGNLRLGLVRLLPQGCDPPPQRGVIFLDPWLLGQIALLPN